MVSDLSDDNEVDLLNEVEDLEKLLQRGRENYDSVKTSFAAAERRYVYLRKDLEKRERENNELATRLRVVKTELRVRELERELAHLRKKQERDQ